MNLTDFAFKNKALIYFVLFILVVGGVLSFASMSKLEDPEIKVKQALVVTIYPGASAHKVELEVTDVLEKAIRSMGDLDHLESRSLADYSEIMVELESTVQGNDIEQKWDMLRRKVVNAQSQLPAGAQTSIVVDDFGDVYGMFYAMSSDGIGYEEMHDYANLVKREIQNMPGVSRVELYGERKPCINIEFRQDKMANLGVHPAEILNTLNNQNKTTYAGYFNAGDKRMRVAVNDSYNAIADIENLLIQGHEDDQLRLREVATVSRGYSEPYRNLMRYDQLPAMGISISMESGGNIISLGEKIDERLASLKESRIPAGIDFQKVFFQPDKVDDAIKGFMLNLVESIAIVVFILMLTMGFRSGVIIGSGLLITILGSFVFLKMFDGTLQRVSLASLIVAMGMLVDNAIVIVDGILIDLKSGMPKSKALVNTTQKTAWPLLGATAIAIAAFLPIFLSPDTTGEYVRDLFIVLAVSLLLSWVLSLTHTPIFAGKRFKESKKEAGNTDLYDGKIYRSFKKILDYLLFHKTITIMVTLALLAGSGFLFTQVKQGFFPDLSYNQLYIEYKTPEGTRINKVQSDLAEIENYLQDRAEVTHVTTSLGGTPSRYNLVRSIAEPSMSYGELIVDFTDPEKLKNSIPELQQYLTEHYPDAYVRIKRYNLMYKKFPIEAMFSGPDPAVLKDLTAQAEAIMEKSEATVLVTNDWEPSTPSLLADYYQPLARQAGLSRTDVGLALMAATDGLPVGNYYEGTHSLPIYLKSTGFDGTPADNLDNVPVWPMLPSTNMFTEDNLKGLVAGMVSPEELLDGTLSSTPLSQATNGMKLKWEEPVVRRYHGQRSMKAQCNNAIGISAEDARQTIRKEIESIQLPEGYSMEWQGEHLASTKSKRYLFGNLPLAIVLMISILIALFKDYKKPIIILLSLPLALIGIVSGMLLFGKEFGFVAIVGTLGLMGMMIKNGVVLLDEIGLQIASGKEPFKALIDSSTSRLRPVMMASLTTILGMIPLLPDDMFGSMAVTIMSGLLVGSVITLIIIPVLYAIFFKVHHPHSHKA
ncbi:efflux RND transporter permease subunit [Marinilabiliaceae bacterium JC017]|nr:efflux RND transporter permease subunit [Marinilabiliaceae bacterium JC017]